MRGRTLEENGLTGTQRNVSIQTVPCSHASTHNTGPASSRHVRTRGDLDGGGSRNCNMFPQNSVDGTTKTALPILLWSIEVGRVERAHDEVALDKSLDGGAGIDNLAANIGAGHNLILDRKGICTIADSNITVVQGDTLDFDEDFVLVRFRDFLLELLQSVNGSTLLEAENFMGRHVDEWIE